MRRTRQCRASALVAIALWCLCAHVPSQADTELPPVYLATRSEDSATATALTPQANASASPAQPPQEDIPEIETDRPDVTDAPTVVPKGSLLDENGFTWTQNRNHSSNWDVPESLFRLGVLNRTEARLETPNFARLQQPGNVKNGVYNPSVGIKQQLGPLPGGFELSVIGMLTVPTGGRLDSQHLQPYLKFPWSHQLKGPWSVGGMQSVFWYWDSGKRNPTWQPTFYLERQMSKNTDLFIEYAGNYPRNGGGTYQLFHWGGAWRPKPTQQLDFHMGVGMNHSTPSFLVGVGYSFQMNKLF